MKEKTTYSDKLIGKVRILSDFLPLPEKLALEEETIKVSIALSKSSIEFYKKEAQKFNTKRLFSKATRFFQKHY